MMLIARYFGIVSFYPLSLILARVIAVSADSSVDHSAWAVCQSTVINDGWLGLWFGFVPFLLSAVLEDASDFVYDLCRDFLFDSQVIDESDEKLVSGSFLALRSLALLPLRLLSMRMRTQSSVPWLAESMTIKEMVASADWRGYAILFGCVTVYCGLNCKFNLFCNLFF